MTINEINLNIKNTKTNALNDNLKQTRDDLLAVLVNSMGLDLKRAESLLDFINIKEIAATGRMSDLMDTQGEAQQLMEAINDLLGVSEVIYDKQSGTLKLITNGAQDTIIFLVPDQENGKLSDKLFNLLQAIGVNSEEAKGFIAQNKNGVAKKICTGNPKLHIEMSNISWMLNNNAQPKPEIENVAVPGDLNTTLFGEDQSLLYPKLGTWGSSRPGFGGEKWNWGDDSLAVSTKEDAFQFRKIQLSWHQDEEEFSLFDLDLLKFDDFNIEEIEASLNASDFYFTATSLIYDLELDNEHFDESTLKKKLDEEKQMNGISIRFNKMNGLLTILQKLKLNTYEDKPWIDELHMLETNINKEKAIQESIANSIFDSSLKEDYLKAIETKDVDGMKKITDKMKAFNESIPYDGTVASYNRTKKANDSLIIYLEATLKQWKQLLSKQTPAKMKDQVERVALVNEANKISSVSNKLTAEQLSVKEIVLVCKKINDAKDQFSNKIVVELNADSVDNQSKMVKLESLEQLLMSKLEKPVSREEAERLEKKLIEIMNEISKKKSKANALNTEGTSYQGNDLFSSQKNQKNINESQKTNEVTEKQAGDLIEKIDKDISQVRALIKELSTKGGSISDSITAESTINIDWSASIKDIVATFAELFKEMTQDILKQDADKEKYVLDKKFRELKVAIRNRDRDLKVDKEKQLAKLDMKVLAFIDKNSPTIT